MTDCAHYADLLKLQPPKLSQSVHREECTQCFDNQDSEQGIDVCLVCFNGGCLVEPRNHTRLHIAKSDHPFTLNVKRRPKPSSQRSESEEPPLKMTKLAIVEEREEDKFDHVTTLKCWLCNPVSGAELPVSTQAKPLVEGVMQSMSSARQSEVQAWEEEITPCEHTLTLEQYSQGPIAASGLAHCRACDLKENLWLCLTCGSLGCGRAQYGGTGGNGHGLAHYEETKHPVSVKLGTISAEGNADIYCYPCNESRLDPEMAAHLAAFGININTQTKTEKSMTELQIEHNLKFDFSLVGEDGKALQPVFGPGLTGLANLGNSCYMASVLQTIFSLPSFQKRYQQAIDHWVSCTERLPADCLECQMFKISDGLLSGRYSHPASKNSIADNANPLAHESPTPVFQTGIKPAAFKTLIGKGHAEFATMRQQDAEEFFSWLLTALRRYQKKVGGGVDADVTQTFSFGLEQRLQCTECNRVRYRTDGVDSVSLAVPAREKGKDGDSKAEYHDVTLEELLAVLAAPEHLEYSCPDCKKSVLAEKRTNFATFPDVLVVHAKKFQLVNWVPSKLDIPVILPADDNIVLDQYLGHGLQPNEVPLSETDTAAAPVLPAFDANAMSQLEGMGFPTVRCQKALLATGNNSAEAAMEWLFSHMDDPDIDAPIDLGSSAGKSSGNEPSPEQVSMLSDMGFTPTQARKALRETGGDVERAVEWLFNHPDDTGEDAPPASGTDVTSSTAAPALVGSKDLPAKYRLKAFISHKGPSVHSGHYVAHIRTPGEGWVLFNDEKVVKADDESVRDLKKLAYIYVFEKA